jgi:chromate reductase
MTILAISGSLRAGSANLAVLRAAAGMAPLPVIFYEELGTLPHFNPDADVDPPPPAVARLRAQAGAARAVIFSSPEYAHGVPGSLKNALDWMVSSGELCDKPILLINASPSGGEYARASLIEVLKTMSANVLVDASLAAPFARSQLDTDGRVKDPAFAEQLRASLAALVSALG